MPLQRNPTVIIGSEPLGYVQGINCPAELEVQPEYYKGSLAMNHCYNIINMCTCECMTVEFPELGQLTNWIPTCYQQDPYHDLVVSFS